MGSSSIIRIQNESYADVECNPPLSLTSFQIGIPIHFIDQHTYYLRMLLTFTDFLGQRITREIPVQKVSLSISQKIRGVHVLKIGTLISLSRIPTNSCICER